MVLQLIVKPCYAVSQNLNADYVSFYFEILFYH